MRKLYFVIALMLLNISCNKGQDELNLSNSEELIESLIEDKVNCSKQEKFYNSFYELINKVDSNNHIDLGDDMKFYKLCEYFFNLDCIDSLKFIDRYVKFILNHYYNLERVNADWDGNFATLRGDFNHYRLFGSLNYINDVLKQKFISHMISFWKAQFYYWENKTSLRKFIDDLYKYDSWDKDVRFSIEEAVRQHLIELRYYH